MRTLLSMAAVALSLTLAAGTARADHDRDLGYLVGGALLGAALAELAHDHRHAYRGHRYVDARHKHKRRAHRHDRHFRGSRHVTRRYRAHHPHVHIRGVYYR